MTSARVRALALGMAGVVTALSAPALLSAQSDVEILGAHWGTTPPPGYFTLRDARPDAFTFERAWLRKNPRLVRFDAEAGDDAGAGATAALRVGPARTGAVTGTVTVPLLLGLYADAAPPPHTREEVQQQFFDGPNPTGTIPDYYAEVSGGRLTLVGEVFDWERVALTRSQVTAGESGISPASRVGEFILQLMARADADGIDWGLYDNDGPDGIPNSGDDDGYVDVLAVVHPDPGGECGGASSGDRVWSHRWSLQSAVGQSFVTSTPAAGGGSIRVSDYTIQPVRSCSDTRINDIGVVAHELGHGFGLPDLYAVDDGISREHQGIGNWGLMSTGSYGCDGRHAQTPCHMSAWSREVLGWAEVIEVAPETDLGTITLPPVETSGRIYRVPIPGTDHYYLLENRQPIGFDAHLAAPGLLVWYIDPTVIEEEWAVNQVNSNPNRMGVRLVEADGSDDLRRTRGNRADAGDPFPGLVQRTDFTAGSTPAARTPEGTATRLTLTGIELDGTDLRLRLRTRTHALTVSAEGAPGAELPFTVNGVEVAPGGAVRLAPFDPVTVGAPDGLPTAPGARLGFDRWADGEGTATRQVSVIDADRELVAVFSGEEFRLDAEFQGSRFGVEPGRLETTPHADDAWFPAGTQLTARIVETPGFLLRELTGSWAGRTLPLALTMDAPTTVEAAFDYVYGIDSETTLGMAGGDVVEVLLTVTAGTGPVTWRMESGILPPGLALDEEGRISGTALASGNWSVAVGAEDALGLRASAQLRFEVGIPQLDEGTLAGPFLATGSAPTSGQQLWLDRRGNGNGVYDLDDLRRHVLTVPEAAAVATTGESRMQVDVTPRDPRGVGGVDGGDGGAR